MPAEPQGDGERDAETSRKEDGYEELRLLDARHGPVPSLGRHGPLELDESGEAVDRALSEGRRRLGTPRGGLHGHAAAVELEPAWSGALVLLEDRLECAQSVALLGGSVARAVARQRRVDRFVQSRLRSEDLLAILEVRRRHELGEPISKLPQRRLRVGEMDDALEVVAVQPVELIAHAGDGLPRDGADEAQQQEDDRKACEDLPADGTKRAAGSPVVDGLAHRAALRPRSLRQLRRPRHRAGRRDRGG